MQNKKPAAEHGRTQAAALKDIHLSLSRGDIASVFSNLFTIFEGLLAGPLSHTSPMGQPSLRSLTCAGLSHLDCTSLTRAVIPAERAGLCSASESRNPVNDAVSGLTQDVVYWVPARARPLGGLAWPGRQLNAITPAQVCRPE
jgi:hypothetical protein